jgi:hypothetical protein
MPYTEQLLESMALTRRLIALAYDEELCVHVDTAMLERVARLVRGLEGDLRTLCARTGMTITV